MLEGNCRISDLLKMIVGNEAYYEQYLFDQQFSHQGWSGIVSAVEDSPQALLDSKHISLHDLIVFELLLEIDALEDLAWAKAGSRCAAGSRRRRPCICLPM